MFFPGSKFPFWYTQNKFPSFSKVKAKKKKKSKKKCPHLFLLVFLLSFPICHFPFTIFLLFFSIFTTFPFFSLPPFFPIRKQTFPGQKSLGGTLPPLLPPPPPVTPLCKPGNSINLKTKAERIYVLCLIFVETAGFLGRAHWQQLSFIMYNVRKKKVI